MDRCDVLIVGAGPAGSTCARLLRIAGWNVAIVDRARFPRDKVCGGWLTPEVFPLLDLQPEEYRRTGLTLQAITGFRTGLMDGRSVETRYPSAASYAIRRCEFDNFLLRRAAVRVLDGTPVASLRRSGSVWVVNDAIESPIIVGAGGHFCPVARQLQGDRDSLKPVVAKELEFQDAGRDSTVAADTPELFFCPDLEGYAWCVRKGPYLNVGIGRRAHDGFTDYVRSFRSFLIRTGRLSDTAPLVWHGHAYHAMGAGLRPIAAAGVLVAGDAAGLAYPESGEGIRPAIESGRLAAETLIAANGRHGIDDLMPYERSIRTRYPAPARTPSSLRPAVTALGRALLHSPWFTRHVVLDKWFLRH